MPLVCLVSQDDIAVVHQSSPPADEWDGGVSAAGDQGQGASTGPDPVAAASAEKWHISVLVDPDVVDGVIVGGVGAHAAPADRGRGAA